MGMSGKSCCGPLLHATAKVKNMSAALPLVNVRGPV